MVVGGVVIVEVKAVARVVDVAFVSFVVEI
jgi:hypothetical protein